MSIQPTWSRQSAAGPRSASWRGCPAPAQSSCCPALSGSRPRPASVCTAPSSHWPLAAPARCPGGPPRWCRWYPPRSLWVFFPTWKCHHCAGGGCGPALCCWSNCSHLRDPGESSNNVSIKAPCTHITSPTCVCVLHSLISLVLSPYSPASSSSVPQQQLNSAPISRDTRNYSEMHWNGNNC